MTDNTTEPQQFANALFNTADSEETTPDRTTPAQQANPDTDTIRRDLAIRLGISDQDRDLLLTGTDQATLVAQAERLAGVPAAPSLSHGNIAPNEGKTPATYSPYGDAKAFARDVFRGDD
jgi:hypothetical protein